MFTSEGLGLQSGHKGQNTRAPLDLLTISGNYLGASHYEDRDLCWIRAGAVGPQRGFGSMQWGVSPRGDRRALAGDPVRQRLARSGMLPLCAVFQLSRLEWLNGFSPI